VRAQADLAPVPMYFSAVAFGLFQYSSRNTGSISPLQLRCTQTSPTSPGGSTLPESSTTATRWPG
jgi:hypothetical protein